jgi:leucyl-tRNA---protein transferase
MFVKHPDESLNRPGPESRLIVIQDQHQPCPYLEGVVARMPLRLPIGRLSEDVTDSLLALGYRRSGDFVYRTQCPHCTACEPTRVPVASFVWTNSLRRVLRKGDAELTVKAGPMLSDPVRVDLFNKHRLTRGLSRDDEPIDEEGYRSFLVETCCETLELSFWHRDALVAISIVDVAKQSLSAVYTFFDPDMSRFSLGTYSILKQIEQVSKTGRTYLYLGMYVAENRHLNYKARFVPQQRLVNRSWQDFNA